MVKTKGTQENIKRTLLRIRPLAGYVVVDPQEAQSKTASGIYLPETAQEKPAQGTVLAIGAEAVMDGRVVESPVSIGDKVIYKKWGGDEIKIDGRELKLVKFDDLIAILEG